MDLNSPYIAQWSWGNRPPLEEQDARLWPDSATSAIRSDPLWQHLRATAGNEAVAARIAATRRQSDR